MVLLFVEGAIVGYMNTSEYGSQTMYIGGSHLNTSPSGHMVLRTTADLLNKACHSAHQYS